MRLFIAVRFSEEMLRSLVSAINDLRSEAVSGNFTRAENLHLTLAFIGESNRVKELTEAISQATEGHAPFEISLKGFGNFGNLYWAGLKKCSALDSLVYSIKNGLAEKGFEVDARPFKPHVTLARELVSDKKPTVSVAETDMTVNCVSLMKSERVNGKLVYSELFSKSF